MGMRKRGRSSRHVRPVETEVFWRMRTGADFDVPLTDAQVRLLVAAWWRKRGQRG